MVVQTEQMGISSMLLQEPPGKIMGSHTPKWQPRLNLAIESFLYHPLKWERTLTLTVYHLVSSTWSLLSNRSKYLIISIVLLSFSSGGGKDLYMPQHMMINGNEHMMNPQTLTVPPSASSHMHHPQSPLQHSLERSQPMRTSYNGNSGP